MHFEMKRKLYSSLEELHNTVSYIEKAGRRIKREKRERKNKTYTLKSDG